MARANSTSSAISTNSPSGGTAGGIPERRSTTCSAWSPACRTPPCETSSTSGSEQRLPPNAATNPPCHEHGRPDRHAIAEADGGDFRADPARYRRLALAALQLLASPTEAMIDAAHQAVSFDDAWAINKRSDFKRAVKAMLAASVVKRE